MTDKKDDDVLDSLDSWEDLLEENQEAAFEKVRFFGKTILILIFS